jgi:hypothetical protein
LLTIFQHRPWTFFDTEKGSGGQRLTRKLGPIFENKSRDMSIKDNVRYLGRNSEEEGEGGGGGGGEEEEEAEEEEEEKEGQKEDE